MNLILSPTMLSRGGILKIWYMYVKAENVSADELL
jgi:hypothetical protein